MWFFWGHFSGNLTECNMPGLFENIILTPLYRHYIFEKPILVFFLVISDKYHAIFLLKKRILIFMLCKALRGKLYGNWARLCFM
jgi:hypothetical protein